MTKVEPIRDRVLLEKIKDYLKGNELYRDYLLFVFGINTALRISDMLKLKRDDVYQNGKPKEFLAIIIQKTGKPQRIGLNQSVQKALKIYWKNIVEKEGYTVWLFPSPRNKAKHLSRVGAWQRLQLISKHFDLPESLSSHTLRKTFGYQARQAGYDINLISQKLGHSNINITRRYIGISDDEVNAVEFGLNL